MANFHEAFQTGLDVYQKAAQAHEEIFQVFDEFDQQVAAASHGIIRIERRVPTMHALKETVKSFEAVLEPQPWRPDQLQALYASRQSGEPRHKLCTFELSEHGYPVELAYARERVRCHDRESLELGLQKLLEHPETGGKLYDLLHAESQRAG